MSFKKIDTVDLLSGGSKQFNANPGVYDGLKLVAEGLNLAGQQGTINDVCDIQVKRNDSPRFVEGFDRFADIGDLRAGTNLFKSEDDGDFLASAFVPFYEVGHPNAMHVSGESELNIEISPKADSAIFDQVTISVYARLTDLPERYDYLMLANDIPVSAAANDVPESLNRKGITNLYVGDPDSVIEQLSYEHNGRLIQSPANFQVLRAGTVYDNRIEDPTFDLAQIQAHTPGIPDSTQNRNGQLNYSTTGPGTIDLTVCQIKNWRRKGRNV